MGVVGLAMAEREKHPTGSIQRCYCNGTTPTAPTLPLQVRHRPSCWHSSPPPGQGIQQNQSSKTIVAARCSQPTPQSPPQVLITIAHAVRFAGACLLLWRGRCIKKDQSKCAMVASASNIPPPNIDHPPALRHCTITMAPPVRLLGARPMTNSSLRHRQYDRSAIRSSYCCSDSWHSGVASSMIDPVAVRHAVAIVYA